MIHTQSERHLLPMVDTCPPDRVPVAILRGIGRTDFDQHSASLFRFAGELVKEVRPCRVTDAFGKAMVVNHSINMQVLHTDHTKSVDNLSGRLMREIITPERNPLVNACDHLAVLLAFGCTFGKLTMFALYLCQRFLFVPEKARVGYLFSIGKGRERFQPDVNTHLRGAFWQAFRFALDREAHVPLARTALVDSTRFQIALDRTVVDHLDTPDFREDNALIMGVLSGGQGNAKTRLRETEAIVAITPTEARKARGFSCFASSKERFERKVNTNGDVLQDLGMHVLEGRAFGFQYRKGGNLSVATQAFPTLRVGRLAVFQQVVVQPTTLIKGFVELTRLHFGGVDPIRRHFMYTLIIAQSVMEVKGQAASHHTRDAERPLYPHG